MEYTEVDIRLQEVDPFADILVAKLNEIEFESYIEDQNGLKAYIQTHLFNKSAVNEIINETAKFTELSCKISKVIQENWNKKWEQNFLPVHVNDRCVIRSDFHASFSEKEYELIITPKMSFGTGHHETTSLMMNRMFDIDFSNKQVLDIGSGTGVLSILASKLGANFGLGIDIDAWALENSLENKELNNISNIEFVQADIKQIEDNSFDIILANINRNIIINELDDYVRFMNKKSEILISGFFKEDVDLILEKTEQLSLELVYSKNKNKWQILHLKRS